MQGCIRGLWAVDTNGAVQSDWVKEVTVVLLKGVKERWACQLIAVEQASCLEQVCCDKPPQCLVSREIGENKQVMLCTPIHTETTPEYLGCWCLSWM